ncbi:RNA polymerase sigma factor [Belliella sp. DSM 111904]|uniref:RNA polymerase sigma factor n=1 Tax=Belliella filtrata TaxID=2923435 RepID=A0ABS9UX30_9BACT|nr:RNA polymerase sigma factor [Belliella filtrata]MCH7408731.1 RNA polymerase sigma factor [Belliella filtrata]
MEKDYYIESNVWNRFLKGDQDAFKKIYLDHVDSLVMYGLLFCKDKFKVEDAIHDVFVELHARRANLSENINIKFYLFACLRRQLKSILNSNAILDFKDTNCKSFEIEDLQFDPLIHNEEQKIMVFKLAEAINQLSRKKKEIIYLHYIQDLSYADISILLGISLTSCRTLMYRAIKDIRSNFESDTVVSENIDFRLLKSGIQLSLFIAALLN